MSGYSDDVETYLWMCEIYKEDVQYKQNGKNKIIDVYGEHAGNLWERFNNDQKLLSKDCYFGTGCMGKKLRCSSCQVAVEKKDDK